MEHIPWWLKAFLALGGAGMIWKAVQSSIPKALAALQPLAIKAADKAMALILAYPVLRWVILGNRENVHAVFNASVDGLQQIIEAVQKRVNDDIDAAAAADKPADPAA